MRDLLAGGAVANVAIEASQRVLLVDLTHEESGLPWKGRLRLSGGGSRGDPGSRGTGWSPRSPGWHGMQRPWASLSGSIVSSFTLTRRMGYTCVRMRLLKPQEPTWVETAVSGPRRRRCSPRPGHPKAHGGPGAGPHPGANLAVHVGDAAVALGGAVELADLPHAEALRELLPDGRPQPVTHGQAHAVPPLRVTNRLPQQVAADLPDVLHHLGEGAGTPRQKRGSEGAGRWGGRGGLSCPAVLRQAPELGGGVAQSPLPHRLRVSPPTPGYLKFF